MSRTEIHLRSDGGRWLWTGLRWEPVDIEADSGVADVVPAPPVDTTAK